MAKTNPIGFRVEPEIKEALERAAKGNDRFVLPGRAHPAGVVGRARVPKEQGLASPAGDIVAPMGGGIMRWHILLFAAFILAGCANPYNEFYEGGADARTLPGYQPTGPVSVRKSEDLLDDIRELERQGFLPIGRASFNGGPGALSDSDMREKAEQLGAGVVLKHIVRSHTEQVIIPITSPSTTNVTAYGPGGTTTATAFTTTTTYEPINVNRYNIDVVFLAKCISRSGLQVFPLNDGARKMIGGNYGVIIDVVVNDSPAFVANIIPGDIVTAIDGKPVSSARQFHEFIFNASDSAEIDINRNGEPLHKTLPLVDISPTP